MSDSYNDPQPNGRDFEASREGRRNSFRGGRGGSGHRDTNGFRIRLSENEMRSARTIQEAFNLRSTVAVLGFAVRTLGEMLEQGKLNDFVNEYQNQSSNNPRVSKARGNRFNETKDSNLNSLKANPFARPPKPEIQIEEDEPKETSEPSKEKEDLALDAEINQSDQQKSSNTTGAIADSNDSAKEEKINPTSNS